MSSGEGSGGSGPGGEDSPARPGQALPVVKAERSRAPRSKTTRSKTIGFRPQDRIRVAVVAWLVVCWVIGSSRAGVDLGPFLERAWPDAAGFEQVSSDTYRADGPQNTPMGYATIGTASGYGGPMRVAVAVDLEGTVRSIAILEHRESPSFFEKVLSSRFLPGLVGLGPDDPIVLGEDVDGVTGATYSALGIAQSVHRGARRLAEDQLQLEVLPDERRVVFGMPEIVLLVLFGLGVLQRRLKGTARKRLRWVTLLGGLVFLGFLYNAPFVLAQINMVLIGYWPEWQTHIFWYLLIAGLLLFKAKREWNVYCYDFCPFGACQEVIGAIGGAKPRRVRWPTLLLWLQRFLTLGAVSLALIYRNPGLTSFEIFGTAFRLEGSSFQFMVLAIILLSSLFIYRPWCRYLCPLHKNTMEGLFDNTRRIGRTIWAMAKPSPTAG